ncbi:MAG: helix-turn-helix transcriptional regulator [Epibacterium sp.]|nr:helix-turn-helix transcriptional regulator [Epibacterium sp.]NQX75263.1 helix-turn-helix transcriptional regulator [Epibacterium sp.]
MAELSANGLRQARRAAGLTQAELGTRVGVSRKTINTIENEVFVPSTALALRLSEVLNLPVENLFTLSKSIHEAKP